MSDTAPPATHELDEQLQRLSQLAARIAQLQTEQQQLYVERAELLLQIREQPSPPPLSRLATVAGVSVPAIIQQVAKAQERRA